MKPEDHFSGLADLVRAEVNGELPSDANLRARARLVERVARGRRGPPKRGRLLVGLAFAAALGGLAVWTTLDTPLEAHVGGETLAQGSFLRASEVPTTLDFSDGSQALLALGGSLRVERLDEDGASLSLEHGSVKLAVHGRQGTRWLVHAGPAEVLVHGTVLDVAWSPQADELAVRVDEGLVEVTSAVMSGPVFVARGQLLRLRGAEVKLGPAEVAAASVPAPTAEPAAPTPEVRPLEPAPAREGSPQPTPAAELAAQASWPQRVATGDFAGVLAEAEARGIEAVLAGAPLGDLVALADAARYARRGDLTGRALSAQRSRFPGTSAAASAAFLLGRAADDGGRAQEALGFYDRYLAEAPAGAFAAEALGRKMVAVEKTSGPAAARPLAEIYLARYPKGAYAGAARRIASP